MRIPVFVSCPSDLSPAQEESRELILRELNRHRLEPRALGRSDYPTDFPLREIYVIAKHCSGGVILGFEQVWAPSAVFKPGAGEKESRRDKPQKFPTPWNHLEAGILFGLQLPLLVFKDPEIEGGIFDPGVTEAFVHAMPTPKIEAAKKRALADVFLKWQARVREKYYQ
jgi:hypothetical protein